MGFGAWNFRWIFNTMEGQARGTATALEDGGVLVTAEDGVAAEAFVVADEAPSCQIGSPMVKHAPLPSVELTSIVPPCALMIRCVTNRPSPVPVAFVV